MPSVLGKLGVTFLPPSKSYRPSPFKYNIPLPEQTKRQPSLYNTEPEEQPDFMSEYEKLVGGRPNRLAYQQAVEEGAPEIHRGKWAKLGALLAAGGAGLGGTPAAQAAKLGISAYQEPQMRSDEKYKQRIQGLGNLAQFEDSDIQEKSKALEFKYNDYYKRKQDQREDKDSQIRQDANARAAGESEENILSSRQKREFDKWIEYQDSKDGNTYLRNRMSGERMLVGKTGDTSAEKLNDAREALKMKLWTELPFKMREEATEQANKMAQIKGTGENQLNVQKEKNQQRANAISAGLLKGLKPGERYTQARIEIAAAIANDPELAQEGLIEFDETGMPRVQPDSMTDFLSPGKTEARAKARQIIADAMNRAVGGGNAPASNIPNAPVGNVSNTPSPNAATAPPSNVDTGKTTTFVAPTGEELTISNDDPRYSAMIADKNLKVKPAVNAPAPIKQPDIPPPNIPPQIQPPQQETGLDLSNPFGGNNLMTPAMRNTPPYIRNTGVAPPAPPPSANVDLNVLNNPFPNAPTGPVNIPPGGVLPPVRPVASPIQQPPIQQPIQPSGARLAPNANVPDFGANIDLASPSDIPSGPIPPAVEFDTKFTGIKDEVLKRLGVGIKVTRGTATAADQAAIKAKADKEGVWRTNADGTNVISPHQTSEAADIMFIDPKTGKPIPGVIDSKGRPTKMGQQLYDAFGQIAEDAGLTWGGRWKERDWGHVQLNPVLPR